MPDEPVFRVLPKQADQTIAAALRQWMPDRSWSQVRKLLAGRRVMISGNICVDAARRLKLSDVVKILGQSAAPPPGPRCRADPAPGPRPGGVKSPPG